MRNIYSIADWFNLFLVGLCDPQVRVRCGYVGGWRCGGRNAGRETAVSREERHRSAAQDSTGLELFKTLSTVPLLLLTVPLLFPGRDDIDQLHEILQVLSLLLLLVVADLTENLF